MADEQHLFMEDSCKILARIKLLGLIHDPCRSSSPIIVVERDEWIGINLMIRDDDWSLLNRSLKCPGRVEFRVPRGE